MTTKTETGRHTYPPTSVPKLVVEFHYDDGDVGAYAVEDDLVCTPAELWKHFSNHPTHKPHHIVLRPWREGE